MRESTAAEFNKLEACLRSAGDVRAGGIPQSFIEIFRFDDDNAVPPHGAIRLDAGTDQATCPITQNPLPKGSLQNAVAGRPPPSNFCSHFAPALTALSRKASKSST